MKWWRTAVGTLLAAVTLGLLIWRGQQAAAPADTATRSVPDPGYIATDAVVVQTGDDGQPLYRLQARRVEKAQAGSDIHVTEPRLSYQKGPGPQWSLRADTGVLPEDADRADLAGSVYVVATRPDAAPLEIRTEHLGVDLQTELATTADPVQITWGRDQVSAVGLRADLKADTLRLESQVHGDVTR